MLLQFPITNTAEVDLKTTYDAVVVGSGAAGGMAAHALTSHGLKVLLLEAGKNQDTSKICIPWNGRTITRGAARFRRITTR